MSRKRPIAGMPEPGATTLESPDSVARPDSEVPDVLALVVVACESAPERIGEVLLPSIEPAWFGRTTQDDPEPRSNLIRQRPEENEKTAPLDNPFLSRRHLLIRCTNDNTLAIHCKGRAPLRVDRTEFEELTVHPGDVFELKGLFSFLCVERPWRLERAPAQHTFGCADDHGIVGESPAAWALRAQTAFAAGRGAHVLITGPSGTGKELVARAIHADSARARKPLVARNAATFPSGLIDAELFGNLANYPNAGMPERCRRAPSSSFSVSWVEHSRSARISTPPCCRRQARTTWRPLQFRGTSIHGTVQRSARAARHSRHLPPRASCAWQDARPRRSLAARPLAGLPRRFARRAASSVMRAVWQGVCQ
jgi:Sigma-54 interaction domain